MKLKPIIAVVLLVQGFILIASPAQARPTICGGSQVETSGQVGPKPVTNPKPHPGC